MASAAQKAAQNKQDNADIQRVPVYYTVLSSVGKTFTATVHLVIDLGRFRSQSQIFPRRGLRVAGYVVDVRTYRDRLTYSPRFELPTRTREPQTTSSSCPFSPHGIRHPLFCRRLRACGRVSDRDIKGRHEMRPKKKNVSLGWAVVRIGT